MEPTIATPLHQLYTAVLSLILAGENSKAASAGNCVQSNERCWLLRTSAEVKLFKNNIIYYLDLASSVCVVVVVGGGGSRASVATLLYKFYPSKY